VRNANDGFVVVKVNALRFLIPPNSQFPSLSPMSLHVSMVTVGVEEMRPMLPSNVKPNPRTKSRPLVLDFLVPVTVISFERVTKVVAQPAFLRSDAFKLSIASLNGIVGRRIGRIGSIGNRGLEFLKGDGLASVFSQDLDEEQHLHGIHENEGSQRKCPSYQDVNDVHALQEPGNEGEEHVGEKDGSKEPRAGIGLRPEPVVRDPDGKNEGLGEDSKVQPY